jgi:hypothetical protein
MAANNPYFDLTFDPGTSDMYPQGYWYCYAEPGYDGVGLTIEAAMAACIIEMSKALKGEKDAERSSS